MVGKEKKILGAKTTRQKYKQKIYVSTKPTTEEPQDEGGGGGRVASLDETQQAVEECVARG